MIARCPACAALRWMAFAVAPALCAVRSPAQSPPEVPPADAKAFSSLVEVAEKVKQLGPWENEYAQLERSMHNLWKENGWNDEADVYARDLALEVSKVPPWEFMKRIEVASSRIGERYGFSEEDGRRFQGMVMREVWGMMVHNAPVIVRHTSEMIEARAGQKPFSKEQIARWTQESEPLMKDVRERVDRLSTDIRQSFSPEQQNVFDRDFTSFNKRMTYFEVKRKNWAKGEWQPSDWGMQDDPIQTGKEPAATAAAVAPPKTGEALPDAAGGATPPAHWLPHDPTTWIAYVRSAEKTYKLDLAQRNSAAAIHAELLQRATKFSSTRTEALSAVLAAERPDHALYRPLCLLFEELRRRVDALATQVQRDQVKP